MTSSAGRLGAALRACAGLAILALFGLPLVWVVAASLREPGLPPPRGIVWLPVPPAWSNYRAIFEIVPLGRYLLNSVLVVLLAVPITIVTASWAGFAMAQLAPGAQRRMVRLALVLVLVPSTALWLTRYVLFKYLLLLDTVWALVAPAFMGTSPFFVLLFYWTFRRVPAELYAAARVDGASPLRIWRLVALPLARPTAIGVGALSFVTYWSDFVSPLLYLKTERRYTLPVGLQLLQQMDRTNWPLLLAAALLLLAPVVALFLATQRLFWPEDRLAGIDGS